MPQSLWLWITDLASLNVIENKIMTAFFFFFWQKDWHVCNISQHRAWTLKKYLPISFSLQLTSGLYACPDSPSIWISLWRLPALTSTNICIFLFLSFSSYPHFWFFFFFLFLSVNAWPSYTLKCCFLTWSQDFPLEIYFLVSKIVQPFCLVDITTIYLRIQGRNLNIIWLLTMIYSICNQVYVLLILPPEHPPPCWPSVFLHCYYLGPDLQYYSLKQEFIWGCEKIF